MNISEIYVAFRTVVEAASGVKDLIKGIMNLVEDDSGPLSSPKQDESSVVSRALHRLKLGEAPAPRIAIVGETSVGKTALVNKLFGTELETSRITADTTQSVLRVQFPSNLVIYDTPGIFGKEKLENITRLFIGFEQGFGRTTRVTSVPFRPELGSDKVIQLSGKVLDKKLQLTLFFGP